jgi:hypothetical protein
LLLQTKGLSLEEIGAKFGDEVAVDLTGMAEEERRDLDKGLILGVGVQVEEIEATRRDEKV